MASSGHQQGITEYISRPSAAEFGKRLNLFSRINAVQISFQLVETDIETGCGLQLVIGIIFQVNFSGSADISCSSDDFKLRRIYLTGKKLDNY